MDVGQVLLNEGAVDLEGVTHEGSKVRAAAWRASFQREERLGECGKLAEEHLAALQQQPEAEWSAARRKAQQRRVEEGLARIRAGEEELKRQAEQRQAEPEKLRASVSDPEARLRRHSEGGVAPSYNLQLSTHDGQGVIVGQGVSQAQEDRHQLQPALARIEENTGRLPTQTLLDGGYRRRQNILETAARPSELIGSRGEHRSKNKLERQGVRPEFFPEHFPFHAAHNCFTCPQGKSLPYQTSKQWVGAIEKHYRAQASDCKACPFRCQCCPQTKRGRLLIGTEEDPKVAEFRRKMQPPEYQAI